MMAWNNDFEGETRVLLSLPVIGMLLGFAITGLYTDALGIPDTVTEFHWVTPVIGLVFGLAVGTLAALAPTRAASRLSPAEAMR